MISKELILKAISWKKSPELTAKRLGISVKEFYEYKKRYLAKNNTHYTDSETIEERVVEFDEDVKQGTGHIKALTFTEPRSPEDIEKITKIDKSIWELTRYWNKEHKNAKGETYWLVSASIAKKKTNDVSVEDMEDLLVRVFSDKKYVPVKRNNIISNKKGLFIYTSDKHIAAHVDGNIAMYVNDYDVLSFEARLKRVIFEASYLKDVFGRFEDIYIIDLGDRMDGMNGLTTRGGHKLPQNMSNREAFENAIKIEKEFYDVLIQMDLGNNYSIINNANSNHGGDFDYMVSRALEMYVNEKYPFVTTHIQVKFIEHIEYGNHVILLTHGKDDADMKHGLPMHLNDKTENYINKYLIYNNIDPKEKTVSLVKGDLHVDNSHTSYGFRYRNVLSLFGGSKWIGTNFGPTHPGCSYDILEPGTGRIFEGKIIFN